MSRFSFYSAAVRLVFILSLLPIAMLMSGCSGNNAHTSSPSDLPPANIMLTPVSTIVAPGGTVNFQVVINNLADTSVTWFVNGITGGNSSLGTVVSTGLDTATYTAPTDVMGQLNVTVTAVSNSDSSLKANAAVAVSQEQVQITINPTAIDVLVNTPQNFVATVTCTLGTGSPGPCSNPNVSWDIVETGDGGNSTYGTVVSTGSNTATYTAPAFPPQPSGGLVHVQATAQADSSQVAIATVTVVTSLQTTVTISPNNPTIQPGQPVTLTANVSNNPPDPSVTFSIVGCDGGASGCGIIQNTQLDTAVYTAPGTISGDGLTVTVKATMNSYPYAVGQDTIQVVYQPMTVSVSPCTQESSNCVAQIQQSAPTFPFNPNSQLLTLTIDNVPYNASPSITWSLGCISGREDQNKYCDGSQHSGYQGPGEIYNDLGSCSTGDPNLQMGMSYLQLLPAQTCPLIYQLSSGQTDYTTTVTYNAPVVPPIGGQEHANICGGGQVNSYQWVPLKVEVDAGGQTPSELLCIQVCKQLATCQIP
jgi:hypothetical protein